MTSLFRRLDRREKNQSTGNTGSEPRGSNTTQKERRRHEMKKFGFATIIASGLTAAFLGLAAPASAGVDHLAGSTTFINT